MRVVVEYKSNVEISLVRREHMRFGLGFAKCRNIANVIGIYIFHTILNGILNGTSFIEFVAYLLFLLVLRCL